MAAQDHASDRNPREETEAEQLDRNWDSLVQELRVVPTGVQFLIGALLILSSQAGFATGAVVLVADVVEGAIAGAVVAVLFAAAWVVAPWRWRKASNGYGFRP
ncbi:DUF6328 family protein [Nocardia sp. NPDC057440]|uniref:DUF6328 family protein n=1 Tax=Nocardia sp. NPDC057440 TaxID=3346134 RepID=UPI00367210D2